jgi:hypothetical protein
VTGSRETLPIVTRPAATSLMPIWAPPWVILNFTLCGCTLLYFAASRVTSGYEAVAPLMVIVVSAEAAAGAATPTTPATSKAAEIRRMRFIWRELPLVRVVDKRLTTSRPEHIIIPIKSIRLP